MINIFVKFCDFAFMPQLKQLTQLHNKKKHKKSEREEKKEMEDGDGRETTKPAFHLLLPQLLNYFCGLFGWFLDSQFSCWVRFWVLGMGMGLGFWDSCSGSIFGAMVHWSSGRSINVFGVKCNSHLL